MKIMIVHVMAQLASVCNPLIRSAPFCFGSIVTAILLVAISGCGGTGIDNRTSDDGGLDISAGALSADWIIMNLDTGALQPVSTVTDLATNARYRDSLLVMRRVMAGTTFIGSQSTDTWAQTGETLGQASVSTYFIAAMELTRGQWSRLSSTTPWTAISPSALAGTDDVTLPACGVSLDQVEAACQGWKGTGHLSVPSAVQWECACRAGSAGRFSWGNSTDLTTVALNAVVFQTSGGTDGPRAVGTRLANDFGLCDMHGNVWEWTSDAMVRGGSWNDGLPQARCALKASVAHGTPQALVGARLVYVP